LELNEGVKKISGEYDGKIKSAQESLIEMHHLDIQKVVSESKNAIDRMQLSHA